MNKLFEKYGKFLNIQDRYFIKFDDIDYFEMYLSRMLFSDSIIYRIAIAIVLEKNSLDEENKYDCQNIDCKDREEMEDFFKIGCENIFSIFPKENFLIGNVGIVNRKNIEGIYIEENKYICARSKFSSVKLFSFDSRKECKEKYKELMEELSKESKGE